MMQKHLKLFILIATVCFFCCEDILNNSQIEENREINTDYLLFNRWKTATTNDIIWYNPYYEIATDDIWPEGSVYDPTIQVLSIECSQSTNGIITQFSPDIENYTENLVFEIMLSTNNINDENLVLHIDLGKISEDINSNGILDTEDKSGNAKLDEDEDTGLDGCFDEYEDGNGGCSDEPLNLGDDPNGDNYSYVEGSSDYSHINGTEGNSELEVFQFPDTEDLNNNGILDLNDNYVTYELMPMIDIPDYEVDSDNDGIADWKRFRISVDGFNVDWSNIEFLRLRIGGISPGDTSSFKIAHYRLFTNDDSYQMPLSYVPWDYAVIPAGEFIYGRIADTLSIDYIYRIMKYEVTNAMYLEYLNEALELNIIYVDRNYVYGHYEGDEHEDAGDKVYLYVGRRSSIIFAQEEFWFRGEHAHHPVTQISWFGANAFAKHYGWRLPTEEEWEKAARGLTGWDYPWGNEITVEYANYWESGDPWEEIYPGTTPVGFYNGQIYDGFSTGDNSSPYGVYDMAGNAWEWTDSWYSGVSSRRVLRGGSWDGRTYYLWTWSRGRNSPSRYYYGFRCVR